MNDGRNGRVGLAILFAGTTLVTAAHACVEPDAAVKIGTISNVGDRHEIVLEDGRILLPAGLALVQPKGPGPRWATAAHDSLRSSLSGMTVFAAPDNFRQDRWGRLVGHFSVSSPEGPGDPAERLLASGLARYSPEGVSQPCRIKYLGAERRARAASLGLWSDPYYAILTAEQSEALKARSGEFVLVEGQVRRLGQTSARFYLDFGPVRGVDFALTISRQNSKAFDRMGMPVRSLVGRRLRVRGVLDTRFGPQIDVSLPDAIERIER